MNRRRWSSVWVLLVVLTTAWGASPARAQSTCPYADVRLDTDQAVDVEAICDVARPWADDGVRIFVFLTDRRPQSEDDWFVLLDQVEAEIGIRGADGFDKNALAFEASTATDLSWAYSVTYGELLYDSPLDTDEAAILRIKNQMRTAIAAGDPTGAFVQALNTAYEVNHPASLAAPTAQPTPAATTEKASSFPWGGVILAVLAVGVLGAGGYVLTVQIIAPAIQRARHRAALKRHLETLRAHTANLLNACDQLLQGDAPQETVLYQLFSAYGGEQSDDLRTDVYEWLRRCQGALYDAFDLRQQLIDPDVQEKRTLEQTVQDWEMLYVTFVGNSERILALTDDELRTLLDPLLVLEREAPDVQLTQQLDELRRELAGGMPLKVELQIVDPAQTDAEGILGYLDRVKAKIGYLGQARQEAPERLAQARTSRQEAAKQVPDPFVMTEKQLFAGVEQRLAQADAALEQDLFLRVIEQADEILQDVAAVRAFVAVTGEHEGRRAEIEAITAQGYRPPHLAEARGEIETDLQTIMQGIQDGDYGTAASWVEELRTDSQRALESAQTWQTLHQQNAANLAHLQGQVERVAQYWQEEAVPAWQTLQTFSEGNWGDVTDDMEQATQTLPSIRDDRLGQITRLNGMQEQKLTQAEEMLARASADLAQAETQFQTVVNRLAEVQAAQANIGQALRLTEADIVKAETLRDREDVKIGSEVDQQIERARERLAAGQELTAAREFIAATETQSEARRLATAAYAAASEQIQTINTLHAELETLVKSVTDQTAHCKSQARALPAVAQTSQTSELVQRAEKALSQAHQARITSTGLEDHAWAEALRAAITAYKKTGDLAAQATQQIAADRQAYDGNLAATQADLDVAQRAIRKAEKAMRDRDAQNAGLRTLERARRTLFQSGPLENATLEALARVRRQAQQAQSDARQAERLARQRASSVQAERRRQQQRASWSTVSSSGSSRRSSSRSSSRRSSSRGSSRRSSSRGSSRRR